LSKTTRQEVYPNLPLIWTAEFPGMIRPMAKAPIWLSLIEVAVHTGHKVLIEVDNYSRLIVGNPQGISGQQLRPHTIHFKYNNSFKIKLHIFKLYYQNDDLHNL
jgi:hypothetical protein